MESLAGNPMENYLKATRNDWKVESSDPAFQANPLLWSQDKQTHRREQFFICRMMNVVANLFADLKEPFKFWKFQISKLDESFSMNLEPEELFFALRFSIWKPLSESSRLKNFIEGEELLARSIKQIQDKMFLFEVMIGNWIKTSIDSIDSIRLEVPTWNHLRIISNNLDNSA